MERRPQEETSKRGAAEHRQPAKLQDVVTYACSKSRRYPYTERLEHAFEITALPRYRDVRVTCSGIAGAVATGRHGAWDARQRNLDRPRAGNPRHPMRSLARPLDQ